ncbi:MAG: D-glycero-alpha-D-manno-heptose-1,7-bisphosphate 7-phosphatase [Bacillota bacterium]
MVKRKKHPAVFLDRDGVLNIEKGYVTSVKELEVFDFAPEAVMRLKSLGYKCICITNQSAVARGMMTEQELEIINKKLTNMVPLDAMYYCPHYPPEDKEIPPYRVNCECRKPNAGMILTAAKEHNINLSKSYFVGDSYSDILASKKAGTASVLIDIKGEYKCSNAAIRPDYRFRSLIEFVEFIEQKK